MSRRTSALILGAALLAAGCRSTCGDRPGCFTANTRADAPCRLTGSGPPGEGCYDAITGQPVPCPPTMLVPGTTIPGGAIPGGPAPRPDELPFPTDMIPSPGVPSAPPSVAPPPGLGVGVGNTGKGEPTGKTAAKQ
ncbi:MAG TPA: hypothetical protein VM529_23660 [Gemmata sp.]|nr:hypothetical protein [Gemmata sp.]